MNRKEAQKLLDDNAQHFRNENGLNKILINGQIRIVTSLVQPIQDGTEPPQNFEACIVLDGNEVMTIDEYLRLRNIIQ